MPTKGQITRERIVSAAAPVFNRRGFAGTSLSDLIDATGLQKGGIYRHFSGKDELALAAFDHAVHLLRERFAFTQARAATPFEKLLACVDAVAFSLADPPLAGGCPILNTAIDSDDTHTKLRRRAASAVRDWQDRICAIVAECKAAGELRPDVDPHEVATVLTSALEGAIMLASVLKDTVQMARTANHLRAWLASLRTHAKVRRRP